MNERIANYCLGPRGPVAHPPMSSTETNRINRRTQHPLSPNPYLLDSPGNCLVLKNGLTTSKQQQSTHNL